MLLRNQPKSKIYLKESSASVSPPCKNQGNLNWLYKSWHNHFQLSIFNFQFNKQVWRNWQTRMVHFAPPRCKFISLTISCKLWIKHLAPPRFSTLNRVKIQREKLNMHPWRNWQTRMVQVHIFERKCRFNSCRVHHWPCNPSQFTRSFLFSIINALISFVRFQNSFE